MNEYGERWMDESLNMGLNGCMGRWMSGWMNVGVRQMDRHGRWSDVWLEEGIGEWMDGWMDLNGFGVKTFK